MATSETFNINVFIVSRDNGDFTEKPRFEFTGEPIQAYYRFKLYTQCACPGRCKSSKIECLGQDLRTCEMSDGTGMVHLTIH